MGTDIHEAVEVRDAPDEPWRKLGDIFPCLYFNPDRPKNVREVYDEGTPDEDAYISNPEFTSEPFQFRNYLCFALFADVRNGTGFAGVETGNTVEPIAMPRGLPDDMAPETKAWAERSIDHTPSWLMLQEILDYDYDQPYRYTGVLSTQQYEDLRNKNIQPDSWSGGISGPNIITVDPGQYSIYKVTGELPRIIDTSWSFRPKVIWEGGKVPPEKEIYVQARWLSKGGLRAALGDRFWKVLGGLADGYDPKNTRLVFGFDS